MSRTIPQTAEDANLLFEELAEDLDLDLDLPELTLPTDFELPPEEGPAYADLEALTVDQLTTETTAGTGVFDSLMRATTAHLEEQFTKGRITGADYAKVYLGATTQVMQTALQFLLSRDSTTLQNLQLQEAVKLAQAQRVRAYADVQIARAQIQQAALTTSNLKLDALTKRNQYVLSKMALVNAYDDSRVKEAQVALTQEQVDTQRAQTKDTMLDGTPIRGLVSLEMSLKEAQAQTALEELDAARAQTKDTMLDGTPISGLVAIEKAFKEAQQIHMENQGTLILEQVETQRAQTKDTLTTGEAIGGLLMVDKQIKQAQKQLTEEQTESQRGQTWETHTDGTPIQGVLKYEKELKQAQSLYVMEQYETQRGQTRNTLSTGEMVGGLVGTQVRLYEQQITSYKRDAESKGVKMLLDTWTARKTIDEGVQVPSAIDGTSLNNAISTYRSNLDL